MQGIAPHASDQLALIINQKRNMPSDTCEVVSKASTWLKAELTGANIRFHYGACEENDHYGYASFLITRRYKDNPVVLEVKIAEIKSRPFGFADVRSTGRASGLGFPFFRMLDEDESRELFLHYLSDFILSTQE